MKFSIITLLLTFSMSTAFAQQTKPAMVFEGTEHNFGTIAEEDGKVTHRFIFTNTGGQPLVISKVKTSCGCTSPGYSKDPILPGQKGYVSATYNPYNRPGHFTKTITVSSNAQDPVQVLYIKGNVTPRKKTISELYPYTIGELMLVSNRLPFASLYNTSIKTRSLTVYNPTDKNISIEADNPPKHLSLKTTLLRPNQSGKLLITYNARHQNDWGYLSDVVHLKINGSVHKEEGIIVSAVIKEDFSKLSKDELEKAPRINVSQKAFNFGTIKTGETIKHEFAIENKGKNTLLLRKISSKSDCINLTISDKSIAPNKSASLKISYTAKRKGQERSTITILSNDPKTSKIVLWIKGTVQ